MHLMLGKTDMYPISSITADYIPTLCFPNKPS